MGTDTSLTTHADSVTIVMPWPRPGLEDRVVLTSTPDGVAITLLMGYDPEHPDDAPQEGFAEMTVPAHALRDALHAIGVR